MRKKDKKPAICYETGLDESFLVGTKKELSDFALSILKLIDGPMEVSNCLGVKIKCPKANKSLIEPLSEIVIQNIVIVESLSDRHELMNKINFHNGDNPIDWESCDA